MALRDGSLVVRNSLQVWLDRTFRIERGAIRCVFIQRIPPPNLTAGAAGGSLFKGWRKRRRSVRGAHFLIVHSIV